MPNWCANTLTISVPSRLTYPVERMYHATMIVTGLTKATYLNGAVVVMLPERQQNLNIAVEGAQMRCAVQLDTGRNIKVKPVNLKLLPVTDRLQRFVDANEGLTEVDAGQYFKEERGVQGLSFARACRFVCHFNFPFVKARVAHQYVLQFNTDI